MTLRLHSVNSSVVWKYVGIFLFCFFPKNSAVFFESLNKDCNVFVVWRVPYFNSFRLSPAYFKMSYRCPLFFWSPLQHLLELSRNAPPHVRDDLNKGFEREYCFSCFLVPFSRAWADQWRVGSYEVCVVISYCPSSLPRFYVPCLEAAPRALSTWSSEPREGQAI